jgi:palmitoyltransferase ZDHHC6
MHIMARANLQQDEPSSTELVFIVLNYTTCVPVFFAVGGFCLYHLHHLSENTTTIEGWEKQKTATLVRKGKILDVCTLMVFFNS